MKFKLQAENLWSFAKLWLYWQELATENPGVVFLKVDVDECEDLASHYEISAMPTFVFVKNQVKVRISCLWPICFHILTYSQIVYGQYNYIKEEFLKMSA